MLHVVTPEQATMQAQKEIVRLHPNHGTLNIDIVSFERLAYRIFSELSLPQPEVLDAGFGTGVLTRRLAERGARITGFDFALAMVETVRRQLPQAELFVHDFNDGWPAVLAEKQFDFIVSTYALHHLSVAGQIAWIQEMLGHADISSTQIYSHLVSKQLKDVYNKAHPRA